VLVHPDIVEQSGVLENAWTARRVQAHSSVLADQPCATSRVCKLEKVLNQHAREGWQLKAITSVEVKGRVGPGGVEGVLVTFERPLG
jgi:hypothetical protein